MATQDPTTNYGWNLPNVGSDSGAWGGALNAIIGDDVTGIDAVLQSVSDTADAALAKAGGTMTGHLAATTVAGAVNALGSVSGSVSLNLASYQGFTATISGATVFTFDSPPSGVFGFMLKLTAGDTGVTWPTVAWNGGSAPTLTSGVDLVGFVTFDGGTTWYGVVPSLNAS